MRLLGCLLALTLLLLSAACGGRDSTGSSARGDTTVSSEEETAQSAALSDASSDSAAAELPPQTQVLSLTVPEGYTLARIGMLLEETGVCTVDEFIGAAQTGDFSAYPLVAAQLPDENRCFRLEGYLFPDTYEIYTSDLPESIIARMLSQFERKITAGLREQIADSGFTADEILVIASIIEKEAFGAEQMPLISSVLHNRLEIGMPLQCDVTISYVEGAIKPFITGDIDRYNEYYNTYKCPALPAGAICNPGIEAIRAALNPADTDYLFFFTDSLQNYYYTHDFDEHKQNIASAE